MRLSELTTNEALDVFCELTPYISNIVSDEELITEIKQKIKVEEGATRAELLKVGADKFNKIVNFVLKKKKGDIFGILGVLNSKTPEEIGKQNIIKTMAQIRDALKDKELIDFFKSCVDVGESE